jgi:hypothetical protein
MRDDRIMNNATAQALDYTWPTRYLDTPEK